MKRVMMSCFIAKFNEVQKVKIFIKKKKTATNL